MYEIIWKGVSSLCMGNDVKELLRLLQLCTDYLELALIAHIDFSYTIMTPH